MAKLRAGNESTEITNKREINSVMMTPWGRLSLALLDVSELQQRVVKTANCAVLRIRRRRCLTADAVLPGYLFQRFLKTYSFERFGQWFFGFSDFQHSFITGVFERHKCSFA